MLNKKNINNDKKNYKNETESIYFHKQEYSFS